MEGQILLVTAKLDPMEQENQVLEYFKKNFTTNPKKLCKMAKRIWNDQPPFIQKGLLENILTARNPAEMLKEFFVLMDEWKQIVPDLIAKGNHGMIIRGNDIHGFDLVTNKNWLKEQDYWNPDQEADIQDEVIRDWMKMHELKHFHGKIVLFKEFGFSGMAREIML